MDSELGRAPHALSMPPGESVAEHKARIARQATEQQQQRERDRLEQRSLDLSAEQRLRLWERLHQLRIPLELPSALGTLIAGDTGLSFQQVREAVKARVAPAPAAAGPAA